MVEELVEGKKQKKSKDSSTDKIDSLFDSHNIDNLSSDQFNNEDLEQTEKMVDQLLENNFSSNESPKDQSESLKPKVEVFDKSEQSIDEKSVDLDTSSYNKISDKKEQKPTYQNQDNQDNKEEYIEKTDPSFKQDNADLKEFCEYNEQDHIQQDKKPLVQTHEKEEIFEIDKPTQPDTKTKNEQKKHAFFEQKEKTKTFFEKNPKEKKNQDEDSTKKSKFSFHFPKLNMNLGLNKDKTKTESHFFKKFKKDEKKKECKTPILSEHTSTASNSGRIHGLTELTEVEETDEKKEGVPSPKSERKKGKSLFNSSNSSFNLFKKKETQSTGKEKIPSEQTTQTTDNDSREKPPEKTQNTPEYATDSGGIDKDVIQLLRITDDLLGKLPDDVIEEFSQSEDFTLYEKVMKKYDILK